MASMMAQKSIPADPSLTLKVIGAGYPRTGTVSLALALQILLKGPVCHSGTACVVREESFIKTWIKIMEADPVADKTMIMDTLPRLLAGYVAITDAPGVLFSGELAEIYPDAIVICSTREPEKWFKSFEDVAKTVQLLAFLKFLFLPMPTLRFFGEWIVGLTSRSEAVYNAGKKYDMTSEHLTIHAAYLKRVVPPSRLHFFSVKDGWEPLCKILNVPVPDIPFPHENDKEAIQKFLNGFVKDAILRWLGIFAAGGVVVAAVIWGWR